MAAIIDDMFTNEDSGSKDETDDLKGAKAQSSTARIPPVQRSQAIGNELHTQSQAQGTQHPTAVTMETGPEDPWDHRGWPRLQAWFEEQMDSSIVRTYASGEKLIMPIERGMLEAKERDGKLLHNEKFFSLIRPGGINSFRMFVTVVHKLGLLFRDKHDECLKILQAAERARSSRH